MKTTHVHIHGALDGWEKSKHLRSHGMFSSKAMNVAAEMAQQAKSAQVIVVRQSRALALPEKRKSRDAAPCGCGSE